MTVATTEHLASAISGLAEVSALAPVWVGGGGASEELLSRAGAHLLGLRSTAAGARLAAGTS